MISAGKRFSLLLPLLLTFLAREGEPLRTGSIPSCGSDGPVGSALKTQPSSAELDIDPVARHAGASESWWQTVSTAIGRQEYQASRGDDGLQAPNRAQNLRTTFRPDGIEVVPRQGERSDSWRFVWETVRFGRAGAMRTLAPVDPRPNGAQVVYARPGLIEWYENSARGLEQGFAVTKRPAGSGPVVIAGQLGGDLRPELRGDAVELIEAHEAHGASVLRYAELKVFDAKGRDLPAQLALAGAELTIVIDDGGALYPVTVDPLMTSPAWTAESDQEGALFGWSVEPAGDVNGDGFSDVIVGAYDYSNGEALEGRAYVYHGSVAGLSTSPAWTAESNQANAKFGRSVRTAGDVNGDGFSDVIVGAWAYDNGELEEGRAFVYYGSAAGLDASPAWMAEGNQQDANFGLPVSTAGDVNGDGFSDVIVGAINYYEGFDFYEGWAFAYYGSAAGLSPTPSWTAEGNQEGAWFGISATAGDVNADGFSDVIVSALGYDNGEIDEGRVFVYHGSATGLAASPAWITESNQETAASSSVATAGDVNGDGFSDVIFSSTSYDNPEIDEGRVWVYYGSAAGLAASPAWTLESNQAGGRFGSVRTAGDVNGDGFSDIIIGSYTYDNEAGHLRLAVYDVQGRQAALLADEGRRAGTTRCTGMGAIGEGRSSPPGSTSCSSSSAGGWRHERSSSRHRRHRLSLPMLGAFSCY